MDNLSDKIKILYLDDEEHNLIAFKALFRREFDVFTTTSPQEAVAYLNSNEVPVILSDQKMPELSGVEFFELTLADFPQAVRILVTGYADIEAVIDAINRGQVYRYVAKPWNENDLRVCILNAIDRYELNTRGLTQNGGASSWQKTKGKLQAGVSRIRLIIERLRGYDEVATNEVVAELNELEKSINEVKQEA
ncbi:MAG: response regulator [Bacteroidetes bacterium]|nr:response regulator [Bacteroidota bacterium]